MNIKTPKGKCAWFSDRNGTPIRIITIHCWAGTGGESSVEGIISSWNKNSTSRPSSNYLIDVNGGVYYGVPENKKANTTSSGENDRQAITIEVSQVGTAPWEDKPFSKASVESLIALCADIVRRHNMGEMRWLKDKSLKHSDPSRQNATVHCWYKNKACPGTWMYNRMGKLCDAVNKKLGKTTNYGKYDGNNATLYDNLNVGTIEGGGDFIDDGSGMGVVGGGTVVIANPLGIDSSRYTSGNGSFSGTEWGKPTKKENVSSANFFVGTNNRGVTGVRIGSHIRQK